MSSPRHTLPGRETKGGGNRVSRAEPTAFLAQQNHYSTLRGLSLQRMQDAPLEGEQRAQEQQGHTARERTHSTSFLC